MGGVIAAEQIKGTILLREQCLCVASFTELNG